MYYKYSSRVTDFGETLLTTGPSQAFLWSLPNDNNFITKVAERQASMKAP